MSGRRSVRLHPFARFSRRENGVRLAWLLHSIGYLCTAWHVAFGLLLIEKKMGEMGIALRDAGAFEGRGHVYVGEGRAQATQFDVCTSLKPR